MSVYIERHIYIHTIHIYTCYRCLYLSIFNDLTVIRISILCCTVGEGLRKMFVGGVWVVFFRLSDRRLRGHKVLWATALSLKKIEAPGLLNRTQLDSAPISVVLDTMSLTGPASTVKSGAG